MTKWIQECFNKTLFTRTGSGLSWVGVFFFFFGSFLAWLLPCCVSCLEFGLLVCQLLPWESFVLYVLGSQSQCSHSYRAPACCSDCFAAGQTDLGPLGPPYHVVVSWPSSLCGFSLRLCPALAKPADSRVSDLDFLRVTW